MRDWQRLAAVLLEGLGDDVAREGRPAWVYVVPEPAGEDEGAFALGLSKEPGALLGRIAPPEWEAVGVVASGHTIALGQPGHDGGVPRRHHQATLRMACLVTRQDRVYCKAVTADGLVLEEPPASGQMLDCLRRCLGLPTALPVREAATGPTASGTPSRER